MPHTSGAPANPRRRKKGFTLIELVMVILLLAILAAIAIPNFIDFRTDAKNAATNGALGAFRAAIVIATASIALREDPTLGTLPKYPTISEMWGNMFLSIAPNSHPVLSGLNIMDPAEGIPKNPWTLSTAPIIDFLSIYDCATLTPKTQILGISGSDERGWCYNDAQGIIWANSNLNKSTTATENTY